MNDLSVVLPGSNVRDIAWTWYSECLVQESVLQLFEENGFTGYGTRPVQARFRRHPELSPPKLWELRITGWGGIAPPESGVRLVESCDGCGLLRYSVPRYPERIVDRSQWDGSDFFFVWPMPLYFLVRERVAECIRRSGFRDAELIPTAQLTFRSGRLGPGRLSDWLPVDRARAIGEPLGIY
jgi:hypothetical protein